MAVAKTVQARRDPGKEAQRQPLTIPFLKELGALDVLRPPDGALDPTGAWRHTYRLWLVQPWHSGGALTIARKPLPEGKVELTVHAAIAERGGFERKTHAVLTCAADALSTPLSWTLDTQALDLEGRAVARVAVKEEGTLSGGELTVRFGDQTRRTQVPTPVTSNWSLLDAVQRLPGEAAKPPEFALLEDLDLLKPEQRLTFRETTTVTLGGRPIRLRGTQQIGRGILPWQYWVDDSGRLLLAFSGVRALIYDPGAPAWEQKQLNGARAAIRRRRKP
jgi:hypothetical protein